MDFDLLIDLSKDSALLSFFVNQSKASLKVGPMKTKKISTYDILVDLDGNSTQQIDSIFSHLNTLKKDA
jgi:hypothetical protein